MGTHPERPLSTPEAAFSGMVAGFVRYFHKKDLNLGVNS